MRIKHLLTIFALFAVGLLPAPAHAGGVVTVCDEAHLLAALAGEGTVTFGCSGVITLTNTIVISTDTTVDGSGQEVTISGNNAVLVFTVNAGSTLNLNRLTVALGRSDAGGGVANSGALTVSNSVFSSNSAVGNGGSIFVPVCYADCGDISLTVSNSTFSGNGAGAAGGAICHDGDYNFQNVTLTVAHSWQQLHG